MAVAHSLGAVVTATDLEPTEPLPALEAVSPEQGREYILDMAPEVRALYETENGRTIMQGGNNNAERKPG